MPTKFRLAALLLLSLGAASCGTARNWSEVRVQSLTFADVYSGIETIAKPEYLPSKDCDRGLGIWQSRWREVLPGLGQRPFRFRLRAEIIEGGSRETGWVVRYIVEQQKVKDLGKFHDNVTEKDWSPNGQDSEREKTFGDRLQRHYTSRRPGVDQDRAAGGT